MLFTSGEHFGGIEDEDEDEDDKLEEVFDHTAIFINNSMIYFHKFFLGYNACISTSFMSLQEL